MIDYYPPMMPNQYFHVFNRGNNRENIFYKSENASYFLGKCTKYLESIVETFAYCLLPNHFHMLVRVKSLDEIIGRGSTDLPGFKNLEDLAKNGTQADMDKLISEMVSEQFRLLFMSYAKAINKQENRVGSLFQKNFKRLNIDAHSYLINVVMYIHANPQLHRLHHNFRDWADSSYCMLLTDYPTNLYRSEVLNWFGGKEQFILRHNEYIDWKNADDWMIED